MILDTKLFKEVCSTILAAIDNSELSTLKESLELKTVGTVLYLNVTNREYFASVKFNLDHEEAFHATVNATQFLKLIATVTCSQIEMTAHSTYLSIKANGNYKIPYIFDTMHPTEATLGPLELPEITIDNPTVSMSVSGDILNSILQVNSKEIAKSSVASPIQRLYYIDQQGCITFTTGACVNSFTLLEPIKVLINNRLVRLFKLFKKDMVTMTLGYDTVPTGDNTEIVQTKIKLETPTICLTAITPSNDQMLNKVPVERIRALADRPRDCRAVLNKEDFLQAVNRLSLFTNNDTLDITCTAENILIRSGENEEALKAENGSTVTDEVPSYSMLLNLTNLKLILESCSEQYVTMGYGDHQAITISRGNVCNVCPESVRK